MHRTEQERDEALEKLLRELSALLDAKPEPAPIDTTRRTAHQALTERAMRAGRRLIPRSNTTTETNTDEHQHH
jgi:hypothetical protein